MKLRPQFFLLLFLLILVAPSLRSQTSQAADNNVNWNELGHNSRDSLYRNPGSAVPVNTPIRLRFRALNGDLTAAKVRVWNDRLNLDSLYDMTKIASEIVLPNDPNVYEFWEVTLPASPQPTVYWYRFLAIDGSKTVYYEDDGAYTGGWGQTYENSPDRGWQLTIYDPAFETPDWVKNAVIYQIFTDRFSDGDPSNNPAAGEFFYGNYDSVVRSNNTDWNTAICDPRNVLNGNVCNGIYSQNFYGGDLQGIIDKLDYLQDLGVTALYLNPIFESPSNHKYDTTDFMTIDDNFGTLSTFQTLAQEANNRGIRIILDGVFNHSSSDSYYFDRYSRWASAGVPTTVGANDGSGACESTVSAYEDWYTFFPYAGTPPAPCSDNRDYPKWFGIFDSLPVYQHDFPAVRDYFINNGTSSVGPYWAQWADGWRLDVAPEIDHGTINDPADDYWEDFRAAVRAVNPDMYIVGEEWGNPTSWTIGGEWDATMNYQFSAAVLSFWRDTAFNDNDFNSASSAGTLNPLTPTGFSERFLNLQERYAPEAFYAMMNLFGSHDTNRVLFLLDHNNSDNNTAEYADPNYDWSDAVTRLKGAVLMQMTLPGAPTIYYGDEVGTVNPPAYDGSRWQDDPYNRAPYPWLDETGTPYYAHMQSSSAQANLRSYYDVLIAARNANPALRTGSFDLLLTDDANELLVYGRKMADDSNTAIVVVNGSAAGKTVTVDVSGYLPVGAVLTDVLSNATYTVNSTGQLQNINAPARNGAVLVLGAFANRPLAVTNLSATGGTGSVTLHWTAPANADNFDVYRTRLSGGGYTFVGNTSSTTYTDTGLTNATTYYYVVVSKNAGSLLESGYSNEASAIPQHNIAGGWYNLQWPPEIGTGNTCCGYPQPLYVLSATIPTTEIYGQIWIDGVTNSAGQAAGITAQVGYGLATDTPDLWTWFPMTFNGQVGNNDEYKGTLLPTSVGTFRYTTRWSVDGGLTWNYTDKSGPPFDVNDTGLLVVTQPSDTTPPTPPENLVVTATTSASVSLGWDANTTDTDLYGFNIYRQNTAAPGFTKITTLTDSAAVAYTDTTAVAGTNYDYYVKAVDTSLNESVASNTVNATAEARYVEVTFTVTVPEVSPGTIHIVGDFNGWNPNDPAYAMTQSGPNTWTITKSWLDGTRLVYKFARGGWEKVEKQADGNTEVDNRPLTVEYGTDGTQAIAVTIENWRDPMVTAFTPAEGATDLPNTTVVTLTWNQAMPANLGGFSLTGPAGAVAGTFSYDSSTFTHTFTPSAPLAGGQYTATVTGATDAGNDAQQVPTTWQFSIVQPPDTTAPEVPTNLTVANITASAVDLTWDAHPNTAGDLAGFTVLRKEAGQPTFSALTSLNDPAATSYSDTSVTQGKTYVYALTAFDGSGNPSAESNSVEAIVPLTLVSVQFVATIPAGTPGSVYLAGNFGDFSGSTYPSWNPGGMVMSQTNATTWEITLNLPATYTFYYKYTRGSWDTVEKQADGNAEIDARSVNVGSSAQTQNDTVANWRDPFVVSFSPASNATDVLPGALITATWNQAMPILLSTFTVTGTGGPVAGNVAYDDATHTHTFTPSAPLAPDTYTVTITGNNDIADGTQQAATTWSFTVATPNQVPVANAGDDATYVDSDDDGIEWFNLDGQQSTDDGTIVSYVWSLNSETLASTAFATVQLPVGEHEITLTVTDDDNATDTDTVIIKIVGRILDLRVVAVCSDNPTVERRWRIENPNSFTVSGTWTLAGSAETGSFSAPSGVSYLTTPTLSGANVINIAWQDELGQTKTAPATSTGSPCVPAPAECANIVVENVIYGTNASETLNGTALNDLIFAGNGHDTVRGKEGDDCIVGGNGHDDLFGNNGNDVLVGNHGDDYLDAGDGNDLLFGGNDDDELLGGNGSDTLYGGSDHDEVYGGNGQDILFGESGHDDLFGGADNDTLTGGTQMDNLRGGSGIDTATDFNRRQDTCNNIEVGC